MTASGVGTLALCWNLPLEVGKVRDNPMIQSDLQFPGKMRLKWVENMVSIMA